MKIIDFHTHIYPEAIAEKATKSVLNFYEFDHGGVPGTAEYLLERGKSCGVSEFVVLPVALKPSHVRHINQTIIDAVSEHPEFHGFGTVHAAMENMEEELEFIQQMGLYGVKIHPDTQLFNIDDERLFPMYDYIQGKMPIMIHTGDYRYDYSHPRRVLHLLELFPKLEVIGAHFGGWSVFDTACELLKNTNCWVDLSSSRQFMSDEQFCKYINAYGADRVLFGTDFPLWDPKAEVEHFLQLNIPDQDKEKIAHLNAERILQKKF